MAVREVGLDQRVVSGHGRRDPAGAPAHFIGSFVLLDEPDEPDQPDSLMVIDGQQRMLTLAVAIAKAEQRTGNGASSVLVNPGFGIAGRNRIVPADIDQADFQGILQGLPPASDRRLRHAVAVADRLLAKKEPEAVLEGILDRVQVVRIVLDRREDAEAVFEALNTTGQPLTQADLVRTALLAAFPTVEAQRQVDGMWWRPTDVRLRAAVPDRRARQRESPKDRIVSEYLRSFLMREGGRVEWGRTYRRFADRFDRSEQEAERFLARFDRLSHAYLEFLPAPVPPRALTAHHVMRRLGYNVHHPLLLQLAERASTPTPTFPAEEIPLVVASLESFFIRRIAVGWRTNRLGRLFEQLCEERPADAMSIWHRLRPHWPSDERFRQGIREEPIYASTTTAMVMLQRLDIATNEKDSVLDDEATVEHVMPQTLRDNDRGRAWKDMLGEDWEQVHLRWLHTLPNLTITRRNSEMSNRSFEDKRPWLADSKFATNREIANLPTWDEEVLSDRAARLTNLALGVWPLPKDLPGVALPEAQIDP